MSPTTAGNLPVAVRSLLLAVLCACGAACGSRDTVPGNLDPAPNGGYVGLPACVDCHREKAASYAHTGMGRAFYPLNAETAVEDFAVRNEIEIPRQGLRYRITRRDGKFWMRQAAIDEHGVELAVDERELVYVVGSGNHSRSYLVLDGGRLFQAPVCWYTERGIWDLCPGYEGKNDHFSREITETCVFCHNARMELVPGERNRYREPIPFGIDCERCHGPGQAHVEHWRSGRHEPEGAPDPTIVNPERLPAALGMQICLQCHLGDSKATERVPRRDRALADYRPGRPLEDVMVPFSFRDASRTDFGLSAQGDRLLLSRCFQESRGKLQCITCHDPHVSVYRKDRPLEYHREKCLGCHEAGACAGRAEERRATVPLADDCRQCHMRKLPPDDHPHTSFTDHWIRRSSQFDARREAPTADLAPIFPEAFAGFAPGDRSYYRARAGLLNAMDAAPPLRAAMWRSSEADFRAALAAGLDTADAWYFLGKVLQYQRRGAEASAAFREAAARDPAHRDAALAWGGALAQEGRIAEASATFRRALERWPGDAGATAELARCEAAFGRTDQALDLYGRAAQAMPWNASFQMNRALLLLALSRKADAAVACREALRLDPGDRTLWKTCAEVLAAAGAPSEGAAAARRVEQLRAGRVAGGGDREP